VTPGARRPREVPAGINATIIPGILGAAAGGFIGAQLRPGDITRIDLRSR